jgi:hypothetical protein
MTSATRRPDPSVVAASAAAANIIAASSGSNHHSKCASRLPVSAATTARDAPTFCDFIL